MRSSSRASGRKPESATFAPTGGGDLCALTVAEARAQGDRAPRPRAGASLPVRVPAQSLEVKVVLPEGYEPPDLRGHAWPSCFVADESLMLDEGLDGVAVRTARREGRLTAELSVRRPVVGFEYSLSWELP